MRNSKAKIKKSLFSSVVPKSFKIIKIYIEKFYSVKCFELKNLQLNHLVKIKVNKIQGKVEKIRRELESTMAKGMQIIQKEAVKHMKEISIKEGYLLVFDANSTVIAADKINISDLVSEKLNKSLPKISIEKKKEKKIE